MNVIFVFESKRISIMDKNRLVTYSLLAHINNTGTLVEGLVNIFIPLAKRAIAVMNSNSVFSGRNISEIQNMIKTIYSIDIPTPVLKNILIHISNEINTKSEKNFVLYADGAFSIKNYVFNEFESLIEEKRQLIYEVEKLFQEFCKTYNIAKNEYISIFLFLEKNKTAISRYLNKGEPYTKNGDFSIEAQFVSFFKRIPKIYNIIKELYLGSILSTYIEFSTNPTNANVELLLDTNFVISLIDLNTPESTDSCLKLVEIAKHNGYKISILSDTIEESQRLILRKAEHFNDSFLTKKINPEDIYNACERRGLTKTDLERIADYLERELISNHGIFIIPDTTKYVNIAKFSKEYESLKKFRNSQKSALHDATAIHYVKEKRKNKKFKAFEKVNCWFVNNAINTEFDDFSQCEKVFQNGYQPEIIKVDILLNILWLSNPNIGKKMNGEEIINVGLPALISSTLNESLPKNAIIKELDDNIQKYAKDSLSDEQVIRIATRIANKQISDIDKLNELAKKDKENFVKRLEVEAEKQNELENIRIQQIENIVSELQKETERIKEERLKFDGQEGEIRRLKIDNENLIRKFKRKEHEKKEIKRWRMKSWIEFSLSLIVVIMTILLALFFSDWDIDNASNLIKDLKGNIIVSIFIAILALIFNSIVIKTLFNKYRNHSNIKAYKEQIKYPTEIEEIRI